jgi:hypothetical protein
MRQHRQCCPLNEQKKLLLLQQLLPLSLQRLLLQQLHQLIRWLAWMLCCHLLLQQHALLTWWLLEQWSTLLTQLAHHLHSPQQLS